MPHGVAEAHWTGGDLASFPTQNPHKRLRRQGNLKDHPSERARFPAWLARRKGIGKAPTADGAMGLRATPEPAGTPARGGGQVAHVTTGAAGPSYSTASRPSREPGKAWHRGKGPRDQTLQWTLARTALGGHNGTADPQPYGWNAGCADTCLSGVGRARGKPTPSRRTAPSFYSIASDRQ